MSSNDDDFPFILAVPTDLKSAATPDTPSSSSRTGIIHRHSKRPFVLRPRYKTQSLFLTKSAGTKSHPINCTRTTIVTASPMNVSCTVAKSNTRYHQTTRNSCYDSPTQRGSRRDYMYQPVARNSYGSLRLPFLRARCQRPPRQDHYWGRCEPSCNSMPREMPLPLMPLLF